MPFQVKEGVTSERPDLDNFNEEADIIMAHQVIQLLLQHNWLSPLYATAILKMLLMYVLLSPYPQIPCNG